MQVLEEAGRFSQGVLAPLNSSGDRQGCRLAGGPGQHPGRFCRGLSGLCRRRLAGAGLRRSPGRAGLAATARRGAARNALRQQPRLGHVHRHRPWRLPVPQDPRRPQWLQARYLAADRQWRGLAHHVPDRAPGRQRCRPAALSRRTPGRRQLSPERQQAVYFRRRARPDRQHPASGAGALARMRRRAVAGFRCSWCPSDWTTVRPMACAATASNTRWASRAAPPAPWCSTAPRAG